MEVIPMKEVHDFLKKAGIYYLATVEGDQPRVRPFGTIDIFDGKLVRDERIEAKQHTLDQYPDVAKMYSAEDDNTEVLYFEDATATISSFTEAPKVIKF